MRLGVLDIQHPQWALQLAPDVEHLGFSRYWLGEHHGSTTQSGSPEVLTGIIAAITKHIRVGPAGVLLRYYSPYKVAQDYRLLEDTFHSRIDLGVARGLGGDAVIADALLDGRPSSTESYEAKVRELAHLLQGRLPDEHPLRTASVYGRTTAAELWVLGTTERAALLAASVGASFAFSDYLARMATPGFNGPAIIRAYRDAFEPSPSLATPQWNVAIAGAVVASTGSPPPTVSMRVPPFVSTVGRMREHLNEVAECYETDEIIVLDVCEQFEDRRRSFSLFAEAAGLSEVA